MRRWLWLGVFFLSASWLFLLGEFVPADWLVGGGLLGLGVVFTVIGAWRSSPYSVPAQLLLVVPVGFAAAIITVPYNLGAVVLAVGLLVAELGRRQRLLSRAACGVCLAGSLLLLQAGVLVLYAVWVSHGHRVDLLSPVVSGGANLLGLSTATLNGVMYLQTSTQVYAVTVTLEKIGASLLLPFLASALFLLFLFLPRRRLPSGLLVVLLAFGSYLVLRFIAVLAWFSVTAQLEVFWDPGLVALSFLPLALVFTRFPLLPHEHGEHGPPVQGRLVIPRRSILAAALVILCAACVLTAGLYAVPGPLKPGRVLIDEAHSDWEDSIQALNRTWYGTLSTYNYYSWAQWLAAYYEVRQNPDATLTPELLSGTDILVLKCPTSPYTDAEVDTIVAFVQGGGGLLLIGDHTDVFGMNTFLNPVAERFGLHYNTDATYDLETGGLSAYTTNPLLHHPVMAHVPRFQFMTSCTLEPTSLLSALQTEDIMIGTGLSCEPGTYATENFFRESSASTDSAFGYGLQAAAVRYGAGRVIAFTDSTVFSSFSVFTDGYTAFSLGVFSYLNQTTILPWLPLLLYGLAGVAAAFAVLLLRWESKLMVLAVVGGALLLTLAVMLPTLSALNTTPTPMVRHPLRTVGFDQQHSTVDYNVLPGILSDQEESGYGTFYVWTQRLGLVPMMAPHLSDALSANVSVVINPSVPFSAEDQSLISGFLQRGGRLLVLDSIRNPHSTANELLGPLGIWISTTSVNVTAAAGNTSAAVTTAVPMLTIEGGTPLRMDGQGNTVLSLVTFENSTGWPGRMLVMVDSFQFSTAQMGSPLTEPTAQQRQIYDTEYFLFDTLFSD